MTRETSVESYRKWKESGMLSKVQEEVLGIIARHGPIGQGEAWKTHFPNWMQNAVIPRFAELERAGAIVCCGRDRCRVTGRTVRVYESTSNEPRAVPRREAKETKDQIIKRLEARIAELERELATKSPVVAMAQGEMF